MQRVGKPLVDLAMTVDPVGDASSPRPSPGRVLQAQIPAAARELPQEGPRTRRCQRRVRGRREFEGAGGGVKWPVAKKVSVRTYATAASSSGSSASWAAERIRSISRAGKSTYPYLKATPSAARSARVSSAAGALGGGAEFAGAGKLDDEVG